MTVSLMCLQLRAQVKEGISIWPRWTQGCLMEVTAAFVFDRRRRWSDHAGVVVVCRFVSDGAVLESFVSVVFHFLNRSQRRFGMVPSPLTVLMTAEATISASGIV